MPRRNDIESILIIGAGPIVIGQACEFDYSGSQACKALRQEGYRIILVNSNPATIMTDPIMADATYIEPLTVDVLEKIISRERPDALLPTLGGQTALNLTIQLSDEGVLDRYGVKVIGANYEAIKKAEDRDLFKKAMENIGLKTPKSGIAHSLEEAEQLVKKIGFPAIIRPAFTLGGSGGGVAYNIEEFREIVSRGLSLSLINEVIIDESLLGWKEYELEVMRDGKDNVVIVCSIENFDPMGVHTGDSITVAPAQTLTDKEYQILRDASIAIIREIGVDTGGSNIQFAVNPENGDVMVIEMNPRVSRSSALASKATGFPIAKFAAKLAVGYSLDEIPNDITKETPASFEPTLDYVVVKIPRFTFEKFPQAKPVLGVQMKSVGEVMAIGRTFKEALQKGMRSLERNYPGWVGTGLRDRKEIEKLLRIPNPDRIRVLKDAFEVGMTIDEIYSLSGIDPWFLWHLREILQMENLISSRNLYSFTSDELKLVKRYGFSDRQIAELVGSDESEVRKFRKEKGVVSTYKLVDTCSAEFEAKTPYYYSSYGDEDESNPDRRKKVVILGSGPNRIGQGIEFDYCCVHCSLALREEGYETIMVNSNPETVSTDYDISDKLYFEPLTFEDVMNIIENEKPEGVIIQFGGQTPLKLALPLQKAGVKILGTPPESIDIAEDRERFKAIVEKFGFKQPDSGTATSIEEALKIAERIGYPVLVRPSYVLGGRAMEIVYSSDELLRYMKFAIEASEDRPVLIDKFLEDAIEVDVDAVADGESVVIAGVMEHVEEAGVHSGDSAAVLPPYSLSDEIVEKIKDQTRKMAFALNVRGLINIQFAVKDGEIYFLEVNPRASRTVPFVSKATGVPWAKIAAKLAVGRTLKELGVKEVVPQHYSVKEVVLPFNKFPEVDPVLGPEMKSTGEVMGIDEDFGMAYLKSQIASGNPLPSSGTALVTLNDRTKPKVIDAVRKLHSLGFKLLATTGTKKFLEKNEIPSHHIYKVGEGRPDITDALMNGDINIIFNTPLGREAHYDEAIIRRMAIQLGVPLITTVPGIYAAVRGIEAFKRKSVSVKSVQEYHKSD